MRPRPTARHKLRRIAGIWLLILGVAHVPLPQPDYHNVRHHDAPGQTCPHHDHLLRWHPQAGQGQDVAILHWHWVNLMPGQPDSTPGEGPVVRATAPDWLAVAPDDTPVLAPSNGSRPLTPSMTVATAVALPIVMADLTPGGRDGPPAPRAFGATFAPRTSLHCLLQRWVC
jgi:hypothetical protein